jgi:hypothetical protein
MTLTADPEAVAHWQSQLNAALADHPAAEEALIAAKAKCDAACADAQAAVAESPSEENRFAEEAVHLSHKAELEAAYARFGAVGTAELNLKRARYGLPPTGASNPAPAGVTEVAADIVVASEVAPT